MVAPHPFFLSVPPGCLWETARLYSQREYAAPKIIPSAANVATKLFLWKAPTEIRNSPRKLLVPGELILAKVEEIEMVGRFGMSQRFPRSTPITPRTVQDSYHLSYGFLTPLLFLVVPLCRMVVNRNIVHRYSSMLRGRDDVTYYDHVQKFCPSARLEPLNYYLF
ncbi:hypothetical protein KSP39_PZI016217 [Platanthera zijinensis]|uniref:Uncharacterized protein n=1 Tax=Platanthera zijinensis TaxID=2320716 RepID=A0AAP0B630_9ASPA